jgi:hypothetical protein
MDRTSLQQALDPSYARYIVASLINDPSKVEGVVHDNGFYKLTLGKAPGGVVLRAHIWLEDQAPHKCDGNIHNHRWSFASMILQGTMTTVSFEVDRDGELSVQHYTYTPDADTEICYVGRARLRQTSSVTFADGDCYYLEASTIHQAQPDAGLTTVTLVARSKAEREYADVYATRHLQETTGRPSFLPSLPSCREAPAPQ